MNEVYADSGLGKWFGSGKKGGAGGGGWDRYNTKGERIGKCGDKSAGEGKPKCLSKEKARKMSKKERANAVKRKRASDPSTDRPGTGNKPINVSNRINKEHTMLSFRKFISEKNVPTNPSAWAASKAAAKKKFDVYPSAYANAWASKNYKAKGGGWRKVTESVELDEVVQQWDHDNSGQKVGYTNKKLSDKHVSKLRRKYPEGSVEKDNDGNHVVYTGQYRKESVQLDEYGGHTQKKGGESHPTKGKHAIKLPKSAEKRSERQKQLIRQAMLQNKNESVEVEEQKKNCGCGQNPCVTYGVKNEALDSEDKPTLKRIIKKLKGASKAHAGQASDLEKAMKESAAWQRKAGKNKEGGLNEKGRKSYERENPGSDLKAPVSAAQAKKSKGGKAAKRRKSFCARMGGMPGPMKDSKGKPTRKALALRKWDC